MLNFLVVFNIFLAIFLLVGVMVMVRVSMDLRRALKQLDTKVSALDHRLTEQQRQVNELRASLASHPDPLHSLMDQLGGWKKNGAAKTLMALGSSLFAAYFKQKRGKVLPSRVQSKDQK